MQDIYRVNWSASMWMKIHALTNCICDERNQSYASNIKGKCHQCICRSIHGATDCLCHVLDFANQEDRAYDLPTPVPYSTSQKK